MVVSFGDFLRVWCLFGGVRLGIWRLNDVRRIIKFFMLLKDNLCKNLKIKDGLYIFYFSGFNYLFI